MTDWFDGLSVIEQFLFATGIFSTLIFVIQLLLSLIGMGGDADADVEGGDGAFGDAFTIRNGVSFLMGFSWGGLMAFSWGLTHVILVAFVGFVLGSFLVAFNMLMLFAMSKLKHEGNINLENAINEEATVTLTIPERRSGIGKVRISIQGRLREYHAITDGEVLDKNASVTVLDLSGSQLVVGASNK